MGDSAGNTIEPENRLPQKTGHVGQLIEESFAPNRARSFIEIRHVTNLRMIRRVFHIDRFVFTFNLIMLFHRPTENVRRSVVFRADSFTPALTY